MRTAVVLGAGVGGLAVAGGLARSGWQVTLVERDDRLRGRGGAQLIWPNGVLALEALHIALDDIAIPVVDGGIRRYDGQWLVPPGERAAEPFVVHADDLHDALMAGLGDATLRLGTEITTVRAGAAAQPALGTARHTYEADLVVAADGALSLVRRRLFPHGQVVSGGYTAWRAVVPWFRAPKLPDGAPSSGAVLGPGQRFFYTLLGDRGSAGASSRGGVYFDASTAGAARPESSPTQLSLLRRWFAGWPDPIGDLLAAVEPDDLLQQAAQVGPLPARLDVPAGTGGVVLLGDAAHLITPELAQGACLAFEDAITLVNLVRDAIPGRTLALALAEYSQLRRARAARVATLSRRLRPLLHARGRLSARARDTALARFAPRLLDRTVAAAVDWSVPR